MGLLGNLFGTGEVNPGTTETHAQVQTPGRVVLQFQAREDFECKELGSVYAKGMKYSVREGNHVLLNFVNKWAKEGKVATT